MVLTFCFLFFFSKRLPHFPPLSNVTPPDTTTSTTRHPSLHLKNRMKPIKCRRAFQHHSISFRFFSPGPAGEPSSRLWLRGSFAASSRALSFFFLSFSPPSPLLLPTPLQSRSATSTPKRGSCRGGKFEIRPGVLYHSSFFRASTLKQRVLQRGKAQIR